MAGISPEKLIIEQSVVISNFFGTEVPKPGDWLFEADEKIKKEKLFKVAPFYLPRRQLAQGVNFSGLKFPLDPWIYDQIKAKTVDQDVDWLSGEWILFDITKRPNYQNGRQMYPDMPRFKEMLANLREQDQIKGLGSYKHVPKDSRFAVSADEIDGSEAVVAKAVAGILDLKEEQITTPLYSTFNYIGNLAYPHLGQADTSEGFRNKFGYGYRLCGGDSDDGGLSYVDYCLSVDRSGTIGFRLQVSSPSRT
ncbi:hypothetical protein HY389_00745 [Candidatus Daviesbacteria bacterium]|nr:hypothetical protein [Candidatus Daviesbacteria bacterium]